MSQNKTVIQGLEPNEPNYGGAPTSGSQSFYTRIPRQAAKGTVVPGMMESDGATTSSKPQPMPQQPKAFHPGKPVVGFLYSISRTPAGEFWPLQIGANTIGQNPSSDIVLSEGTVSTDHALIVTRQVKGGIIAAITDTRSTNGTMINGEVIGFSAEECHNGDIITIGNNYQLVLILVDTIKLGLTVCKDFIPTATDEQDDDFGDDIPNFDPNKTKPGGFGPYDNGPATWGNTGGYVPNDGTVGLDGSSSNNNHGGTVPM